MYKSFGVDQVYLIVSDGFAFCSACPRYHTLPIIGDVNREFTTYLNKQVNDNSRDASFLMRFWNYQVLITDGTIEHMTQQPLDNYLVTMLKETKNIGLVKDLGLKNDLMIWTPTFLSRTINAARDVYYYKLHPNLELKQHLFSKIVDNKR